MKSIIRIFAALLGAAVIVPFFGTIAVEAASTVAINEENFPDPNFRACIKRDFDENGDGYLNKNEIELIWNVHCENSNVYSVKGIEHFPYLKGLWCKGNHITELDLSGNPDLRGIWCSFNDFTSLDFSDCPKLEWVYCFNCKLESLNVSNNPKMAYIECNANPDLKTLDLSKNPEMENLFCSNCGLTSLDLTNNPRMCELAAFYNDLEEIDVSYNPNLKRFDIWHNPRLGNVDVSNLPGLQYYNCAWTNLTKIDVSKNPELVELVCGYNDGLTSLDTSHNPKLAYLAVECNVNLKKLDVSNNPRLYYFLAFGLSSIDTIDISKNSRLCKAFNEGVYVHETENLGNVYSMTIDYGGSSDPFDELRHCVCFDDRAEIIGTYNGTNDVPDSVLDTNDGHSDSEQFVTRADAMQALYVAAESPEVKGTSRFTDVAADAPYAAAIKWGEDHKICFGYPNISSETFCPDELISRQDFAIMAHRYAEVMGFGTAFDYGRTDWFDDFFDIDFYAWGPFTWTIQWRVLPYDKDKNICYPRGRITKTELEAAVAEIFDLDEGAGYSGDVGGNDGNPDEPAPGQEVTVADFVERLYTIALGRKSEKEGKEFWVNEITSGNRTGADCAQFFLIDADEFMKRGLSNEDFVEILYMTFFNRASEVEGKSFWVGELKKGTMTKVDVIKGFIDSKEWCNVCATYGVRSGAPTAKADIASKNATNFATRLYTCCLGRDPEEVGLTYWSLALTNLEQTGCSAAKEFFTCKEFVDFGLEDDEYLKRLYTTFMDRKPEESEIKYWIGEIVKGTQTRDSILAFFGQSEEFTKICKTYGIDRGTI